MGTLRTVRRKIARFQYAHERGSEGAWRMALTQVCGEDLWDGGENGYLGGEKLW